MRFCIVRFLSWWLTICHIPALPLQANSQLLLTSLYPPQFLHVIVLFPPQSHASTIRRDLRSSRRRSVLFPPTPRLSRSHTLGVGSAGSVSVFLPLSMSLFPPLHLKDRCAGYSSPAQGAPSSVGMDSPPNATS